MAKNSTEQVVVAIEGYFSKLPPLPANWREVIVKIVPWIALIFGILGVLGSVAAFGALTILSPFVLMGGGVGAASGGIIGAVLAFISSALLLASFPGLNSKKTSGWNLLFWSEAVSIISSIVAISIGGVLMGLIGLYLIFQIKSHYR